MKRILALILATLMFTCLFAGCGSSEEDEGVLKAANSQLWSIQESGKLVIGITSYAPMYYTNSATVERAGFEYALAKAICQKLGVEPEFVEVTRDDMSMALVTEKEVDCIISSMPITDANKASMIFSMPYMQGTQVMVTKAENAAKFSKTAAGASFTAEERGAGVDAFNKAVKSKDAYFVSAETAAFMFPEATMEKALEAVKNDSAEIAIVEKAMAKAYVGEGKQYNGLVIIGGKELPGAQYGIAIRRNSDLKATLDEIITGLATAADGKTSELEKIAAAYGVQDMLIKG